MLRLKWLVLTLAAFGCSPSTPSGEDGGGAAGGSAAGGSAAGGSAAGGSAAGGSATGGGAAVIDAGVTNQVFDQSLYTASVFEGTLELGQPVSSTQWLVAVNLYDRTTTALVADAGVTAGPPGQMVVIPGVPNSGYRASNAFQGAQTSLVLNIEYGQAWMRGAKVPCPSIHSFTWTKTMLGNGDERHVVAWTPSNEPGVIVNMVGDIDAQFSKPDTGQYEWTQAPRSGARMVQLVRRIDLAVPPRSTLQCFVRVRTTL